MRWFAVTFLLSLKNVKSKNIFVLLTWLLLPAILTLVVQLKASFFANDYDTRAPATPPDFPPGILQGELKEIDSNILFSNDFNRVVYYPVSSSTQRLFNEIAKNEGHAKTASGYNNINEIIATKGFRNYYGGVVVKFGESPSQYTISDIQTLKYGGNISNSYSALHGVKNALIVDMMIKKQLMRDAGRQVSLFQVSPFPNAFETC